MKGYFKERIGVISLEILCVILTLFLIIDFILIARFVSAPLSFILMLIILTLWVIGYTCLQGSKESWMFKVAYPALKEICKMKGEIVFQKSFQANLINNYKLVNKDIICKDTRGLVKRDIKGNVISFGEVLLLDGVTTTRALAYRFKCRTGVFKTIHISNDELYKNVDHGKLFETGNKTFDKNFISLVSSDLDAKSFLTKKNLATFNKLEENGVKFTLYIDNKQVIVLRNGCLINDKLPTLEEYEEELKEYFDFASTVVNLFSAKKS